MTREPHDTRAAVVFRHTWAALRSSALCERKLAARIAEAYIARVPLADRVVAFHAGTTTDDLLRAEKANAQLFGRFLRGVVKLPADLEEAWVQALPEPHREECARELVRRYGFLPARAPTSGAGPVATLGVLLREFGETVGALEPIVADGRVDGADAPHLKRALKELNDLQAALVSFQAQLTDALPDHGERTP